MTKKKSAAQRLREWRGERTLSEAGQRLGFALQNLWEYEHGVSKPGLQRAVRIEDVTGIPARDWL